MKQKSVNEKMSQYSIKATLLKNILNNQLNFYLTTFSLAHCSFWYIVSWPWCSWLCWWGRLQWMSPEVFQLCGSVRPEVPQKDSPELHFHQPPVTRPAGDHSQLTTTHKHTKRHVKKTKTRVMITFWPFYAFSSQNVTQCTLVWAALMLWAGLLLKQVSICVVSASEQPSSLARDAVCAWALDVLITTAGENTDPPYKHSTT